MESDDSFAPLVLCKVSVNALVAILQTDEKTERICLAAT